MKENINIQDKKTVIVLKQGNIEEQNADIILNWVNPDLRSGPPSFLKIHNKAGTQFFNNVISYETGIRNIKDGDCFITIPGDLDCKCVIHSIMPRSKNQYMINFRNIMFSLNEYSKNNLCRSMAIYIPEQPDQCMVGIKEFLLDCGLKELIIMYMTDIEKNKIINFYSKFKNKTSKIDKINILLEKIFIYLGKKNRIPIFFENLLWNNKKIVKID